MQYLINEGHFSLPGNWQDNTMNILTPVLSDIAGANLVVTREILPEGAEFSDYLAVQKKKFRTELKAMTFTWKNPAMWKSVRRNTGSLAGTTTE